MKEVAKKNIRDLLILRRSSLSIFEQISLSERIHKKLIMMDEWNRARTIMLYISVGSEVMTLPLINQVVSEGRTLVLPKVVDRRIVAVAVGKRFRLVSGYKGILEPCVGEVFDSTIDVAIIPLVGFDKRGYRLGYGGGFYDRFLSENMHMVGVRVGIAYECQMVEFLPVEVHDVKLDIVVTERQIHRF